MEKPSNIIIRDVNGSVVTVGDGNLIEASIKFSKVKENEISADAANWRQVIDLLAQLQNEVKKLSDDHETIRDVELVPEIAKAKAEAKSISEDASQPKKNFVDRLKAICDVSSKVIDIGAKVSPYILGIGKLIGVMF